MKKDARIEGMITAAAKGFESSLDRFNPAVESNGINERNLTFQLARVFCKSKGHAFFEIPFKLTGKQRTDRHFDACLFDDQHCVLIEAKRLYSGDKSISIVSDINRLKTFGRGSATRGFEDRHGRPPRKMIGLVIAETWEKTSGKRKWQDVRRWWVDGDGDVRWKQGGYPPDWKYSSIRVRRGEDGVDLHWLYSYGCLKG